jgi:hypothetical protein
VDEVTVAVFRSRGEAEIVRVRLEAAGVNARVAADDEGGLNPGFFGDYGVRLVVLAPDLEAARDAIDSGGEP